MSFLDDVMGIFGGGDPAPVPNIMSTQDAINQTYGTLQGALPGFTAYNQALQPVMTGLQLSSENQVFGPAANQLQQGTYQSILDQLNLGESLSPELTADITRKLLESGSATGFGASPGGVGNVILQTALEGERRGQMRRNEALGAVGMLPSSSYVYQPQGLFNANDIFGDIRGVDAQNQQNAALAAAQDQQQFQNLFKTGLTIAGTVAGGVFGGVPGAMLGATAGGLAGNVLTGSGSSGTGGASNPFGSLLGGIGGPSSGIGSNGYLGDVNTGSSGFGNLA